MNVNYITNWFETKDVYIEKDDIEEWIKNGGIEASMFYPNEFKDIVIPSKYNGHNCIAIGVAGFENKTNLETVIIEQGIKYIESNAFYNCTKLNRIYLPNTIEKIDSSAFYRSNIKEIFFVEGIKEIDLEWFDKIGECFVENVVIHLPKTVETIRNENYGGFIFVIDKDNPNYDVKNGFLIDKRINTIINQNYNLEQTIIPKGVKHIKLTSCYVWADENNDFYIPEGVETIDNDSFEIYDEDVVIHLPSTLKATVDFYVDKAKIKYVFDNGSPYLEIKNGKVVKKEWI